MQPNKKIWAGLALSIFASTALAVDQEVCLECHYAEDYEGMSAEEIVDAIRSDDIDKHSRLPEISDADLAAIAAALTGG